MNKRNLRNLIISDFYCTCCGLKNFPIVRKVGREREPGHLKKLFCLNCQTEKNMVEIKPRGKYTLDDFLIEYNHGNFDTEGNRIEKWEHFVKEHYCDRY